MSFFRGLWKSNSKHKKLCEEWALANSCESVGPSTSSASCSTTSCSTASASSSRTGPDDTDIPPETFFSLKYLGSTLVESPSSEKETADAVKTIVGMAKASGKKLQRISLAVSLRGIRMTDLATDEDQLRVSIYRISYCSADGAHDHVFAFIATNPNETLECHAYLCPKRKVAQTVTLTVAQAFNRAYELWQLSEMDCNSQDKDAQLEDEKKETDKKSTKDKQSATELNLEKKSGSPKNIVIDMANDVVVQAKVESWVSFDECPAKASDGIPLQELKSPTDSSPDSSTTTPTTGSSNRSVATQQPKPQCAWLDVESGSRSHALDLVCSS
ncbi:PREDICTED: low density lipoprotein receptor adapter protein 1-like [Ceratosolen solmsi marchali]|uniref:Low density lipoprotein receptor adapter protein 1-like n=1 Tax=Ceratosolen solmsi marchali TaxID=326594 RepID=A0AAJ6YY63_9HYME|nr:PREDICTED: low density lipoprotein receptor adapter protein 1-like [Ceratosolen solmsi marchali]